MCFALVESQTFIGLTFLYSGNKYMHNYYRWNFIEKWEIDIKALNDATHSYSNKYNLKEFIYMLVHQVSRMFERGINYLENRGRFENFKFEEVIDSEQLKKVRYMVKNDIFDLILKEYGKHVHLEIRAREPPCPETPDIVVYDIYDRKMKATFVVAPQPEYDSEMSFRRLKWRCGCMYSYKSGLPCAHEMKVALLTGTSIFDQVNEYWHSENKNKRTEYMTRRKTRRNTEK